jgi:hypothetical protein
VRRAIHLAVICCCIVAIFPRAVAASESVEPGSERKWNARSVQVSLSRSLFRQSSAIKNGALVKGAIETAAAAWSSVAPVTFRLVESDLDSISDSRSGGDGKSLLTVAATAENIALFPEGANAPPAYTRLFFNRQGSIIEADVVLNPFVQFSTDATAGTFDLQSVITHELGHVLGLGHSPSMSATMYSRVPQNRNDVQQWNPTGKLSPTDISMIRSLYGASNQDIDCCASVVGNIPGKSTVVWAEEASSGRVVAAEVFTKGSYSLGGFMIGRYRVLAQPFETGAAAELAVREFELPTRLKTTALNTAPDVHLKYIGLNGELGSVPVHLSRGRTYQIVLGGVGLDPSNTRFGFNTPAISIMPGSVSSIEYGRGLSAIVISINVDSEAPEGDYSIFAESASGARRYLIGAISVD